VLSPSREWTVSAFQEADLFVFGSRIESSPLVILESMAAGKPFVSTNCGDVSDRKEFGSIIKSEEEMAAEIDRLLGDAELRTQLGREARRAWSDTYAWEKIAERYEALYRSLADAR
jgi:glycosyltransferase involved in cell wall biosynthesis